jgi:hypothetical protein
MPARLIEHHRRMFVSGNGFGEAVQERLHRRRTGIGHQQCEGVVSARLNGGEDIREGEPLIAKPRRALAALPPDMADAALLADARICELDGYASIMRGTLPSQAPAVVG